MTSHKAPSEDRIFGIYITHTFNTEEEILDFQLMFEGAYDPAFPSSQRFVQN